MTRSHKTLSGLCLPVCFTDRQKLCNGPSTQGYEECNFLGNRVNDQDFLYLLVFSIGSKKAYFSLLAIREQFLTVFDMSSQSISLRKLFSIGSSIARSLGLSLKQPSSSAKRMFTQTFEKSITIKKVSCK